MNKKELSIWVVIGFFFAAGMTMLILALNGVFGITENLNGYVANIAKYDSIGVSTVTSNSSQSTTLSLSQNRLNLANNGAQKTVLTGVTNGNIEAVAFGNNGIFKVPNMNLTAFCQTTRYIFLKYSTAGDFQKGDANFYNAPNAKSYVIDKETNLTFSLGVNGLYYVDLGTYGYGSVGSDCGDYVVFEMNFNYYKLGVVDGRLEVREILNAESFPGETRLCLSDIYGNSIVERYNNQQTTYYILNNKDQLLPLDYSLDLCSGIDEPGTTFRGVDGKIYNGNTVLNENGEFVPADYVLDGYILPAETLFYSDGTSNYYSGYSLGEASAGFWFYGANVIKVTENEGRYTFEKIPLNTDSTITKENTTVSGTNLFMIKNDHIIISYDLLTGNSREIQVNSDIIINDIEQIGYDMIKFSGINLNQYAVNGLVDKNGKIFYEFTPPEFTCFYIMPLN